MKNAPDLYPESFRLLQNFTFSTNANLPKENEFSLSIKENENEIYICFKNNKRIIKQFYKNKLHQDVFRDFLFNILCREIGFLLNN